MNPITVKKIGYTLILTLNLTFLFLIGFSIPFMESNGKYLMGIILIPLLIVIGYIIVDRFHFILRKTDDLNNKSKENKNESYQKTHLKKDKHIQKKIDKLILKLDEKYYIFSIKSITILLIGSPLLFYFFYIFFHTDANNWLEEIATKQTVFILNIIFDIKSQVVFSSEEEIPWMILILQKENIFFITRACTAVHAFSIFGAIIILIPHSQNQATREDIIWRKTKALTFSIIAIYILNILRLILLIYLNYIGIPLEPIHMALNYLSGIVGALIFMILLYKWTPEFYVSIYYMYRLIIQKINLKALFKNN